MTFSKVETLIVAFTLMIVGEFVNSEVAIIYPVGYTLSNPSPTSPSSTPSSTISTTLSSTTSPLTSTTSTVSLTPFPDNLQSSSPSTTLEISESDHNASLITTAAPIDHVDPSLSNDTSSYLYYDDAYYDFSGYEEGYDLFENASYDYLNNLYNDYLELSTQLPAKIHDGKIVTSEDDSDYKIDHSGSIDDYETTSDMYTTNQPETLFTDWTTIMPNPRPVYVPKSTTSSPKSQVSLANTSNDTIAIPIGSQQVSSHNEQENARYIDKFTVDSIQNVSGNDSSATENVSNNNVTTNVTEANLSSIQAIDDLKIRTLDQALEMAGLKDTKNAYNLLDESYTTNVDIKNSSEAVDEDVIDTSLLEKTISNVINEQAETEIDGFSYENDSIYDDFRQDSSGSENDILENSLETFLNEDISSLSQENFMESSSISLNMNSSQEVEDIVNSSNNNQRLDHDQLAVNSSRPSGDAGTNRSVASHSKNDSLTSSQIVNDAPSLFNNLDKPTSEKNGVSVKSNDRQASNKTVHFDENVTKDKENLRKNNEQQVDIARDDLFEESRVKDADQITKVTYQSNKSSENSSSVLEKIHDGDNHETSTVVTNALEMSSPVEENVELIQQSIDSDAPMKMPITERVPKRETLESLHSELLNEVPNLQTSLQETLKTDMTIAVPRRKKSAAHFGPYDSGLTASTQTTTPSDLSTEVSLEAEASSTATTITSFTTKTVFGFLDYITTIDNTVIIFTNEATTETVATAETATAASAAGSTDDKVDGDREDGPAIVTHPIANNSSSEVTEPQSDISPTTATSQLTTPSAASTTTISTSTTSTTTTTTASSTTSTSTSTTVSTLAETNDEDGDYEEEEDLLSVSVEDDRGSPTDLLSTNSHFANRTQLFKKPLDSAVSDLLSDARESSNTKSHRYRLLKLENATDSFKNKLKDFAADSDLLTEEEKLELDFNKSTADGPQDGEDGEEESIDYKRKLFLGKSMTDIERRRENLRRKAAFSYKRNKGGSGENLIDKFSFPSLNVGQNKAANSRPASLRDRYKTLSDYGDKKSSVSSRRFIDDQEAFPKIELKRFNAFKRPDYRKNVLSKLFNRGKSASRHVSSSNTSDEEEASDEDVSEEMNQISDEEVKNVKERNTDLDDKPKNFEPTIRPTAKLETAQAPESENLPSPSAASGQDAVTTLPAIRLLDADSPSPSLTTTTESFTTTETIVRPTVLPIIIGSMTSYQTLSQTYSVTRQVTAVKTLPPMEMYEPMGSEQNENLMAAFNSGIPSLELPLDQDPGSDLAKWTSVASEDTDTPMLSGGEENILADWDIKKISPIKSQRGMDNRIADVTPDIQPTPTLLNMQGKGES